MARTLDELIGYLETLTGRAPVDDLMREMKELEIELEDVASHLRFSEKAYARNLVRMGDWYSVLVLCWRNGQRSPIHDHAGSSCGVRILLGTATETLFDFAPNGAVKATFSRDLPQGHRTASEDQDMHQISNLQAGGREPVTLHVYSPPLMRMGTYLLTDASRGQEFMLPEYCQAGGI
ncbi:MAG: cysteine dioxygenase family protein [Pirellulales bacterium]|nr:cysteine dioxygenase family protein [Pirellulales bacterium]